MDKNKEIIVKLEKALDEINMLATKHRLGELEDLSARALVDNIFEIVAKVNTEKRRIETNNPYLNMKIYLNEDFDVNPFECTELEKLGYTYSSINGAFVSKDSATMVVISRTPYQRQVIQNSNDHSKHINNLKKLEKAGAIKLD